MKSKRVLVLADLHCGHRAGLTHPKWQYQADDQDTIRGKWARVQKESYLRYMGFIGDIGAVDAVIVNGDTIDGKGTKSGGVEQVTSDRGDQAEIAVACLRKIQGKPKFFMSFGTSYHTAEDGEEHEREIAKELKAEHIGAHDWLDVNKCIIDYKHHLGSSSVPYSRATSLTKDAVWNSLWAVRDEQPKADILIRSHTHYYVAIRATEFYAVSTPALQSMGSIHGAKRCSGTVDWGMLLFTIRGKQDFDVEEHIVTLESTKAKAVKL